MYDGSKLVFDTYDASAVSQLFPGALVSVVSSPEPNALPGYKDLVVGIQGSALVPVDVGQNLVLSLTFQRASATTFDPTPLKFNPGRTRAATPATAGTEFSSSSLMLSYQ